MFSNWGSKPIYKLILKKIIGRIVKDYVNLEDFDFRWSSGIWEFSGMELNVEYLNSKVDPKLGIFLESGFVKHMRLKIPWTSILSYSFSIELDVVNVKIAPNSTSDADDLNSHPASSPSPSSTNNTSTKFSSTTKKTGSSIFSTFSRSTNRKNELNSTDSNADLGSLQSSHSKYIDKGILSRLVQKILLNLRVQLTNLTVEFRDAFRPPNSSIPTAAPNLNTKTFFPIPNSSRVFPGKDASPISFESGSQTNCRGYSKSDKNTWIKQDESIHSPTFVTQTIAEIHALNQQVTAKGVSITKPFVLFIDSVSVNKSLDDHRRDNESSVQEISVKGLSVYYRNKCLVGNVTFHNLSSEESQNMNGQCNVPTPSPDNRRPKDGNDEKIMSKSENLFKNGLNSPGNSDSNQSSQGRASQVEMLTYRRSSPCGISIALQLRVTFDLETITSMKIDAQIDSVNIDVDSNDLVCFSDFVQSYIHGSTAKTNNIFKRQMKMENLKKKKNTEAFSSISGSIDSNTMDDFVRFDSIHSETPKTNLDASKHSISKSNVFKNSNESHGGHFCTNETMKLRFIDHGGISEKERFNPEAFDSEINEKEDENGFMDAHFVHDWIKKSEKNEEISPPTSDENSSKIIDEFFDCFDHFPDDSQQMDADNGDKDTIIEVPTFLLNLNLNVFHFTLQCETESSLRKCMELNVSSISNSVSFSRIMKEFKTSIFSLEFFETTYLMNASKMGSFFNSRSTPTNSPPYDIWNRENSFPRPSNKTRKRKLKENLINQLKHTASLNIESHDRCQYLLANENSLDSYRMAEGNDESGHLFNRTYNDENLCSRLSKKIIFSMNDSPSMDVDNDLSRIDSEFDFTCFKKNDHENVQPTIGNNETMSKKSVVELGVSMKTCSNEQSIDVKNGNTQQFLEGMPVEVGLKSFNPAIYFELNSIPELYRLMKLLKESFSSSKDSNSIEYRSNLTERKFRNEILDDDKNLSSDFGIGSTSELDCEFNVHLTFSAFKIILCYSDSETISTLASAFDFTSPSSVLSQSSSSLPPLLIPTTHNAIHFNRSQDKTFRQYLVFELKTPSFFEFERTESNPISLIPFLKAKSIFKPSHILSSQNFQSSSMNFNVGVEFHSFKIFHIIQEFSPDILFNRSQPLESFNAKCKGHCLMTDCKCKVTESLGLRNKQIFEFKSWCLLNVVNGSDTNKTNSDFFLNQFLDGNSSTLTNCLIDIAFKNSIEPCEEIILKAKKVVLNQRKRKDSGEGCGKPSRNFECKVNTDDISNEEKNFNDTDHISKFSEHRMMDMDVNMDTNLHHNTSADYYDDIVAFAASDALSEYFAALEFHKLAKNSSSLVVHFKAKNIELQLFTSQLFYLDSMLNQILKMFLSISESSFENGDIVKKSFNCSQIALQFDCSFIRMELDMEKKEVENVKNNKIEENHKNQENLASNQKSISDSSAAKSFHTKSNLNSYLQNHMDQRISLETHDLSIFHVHQLNGIPSTDYTWINLPKISIFGQEPTFGNFNISNDSNLFLLKTEFFDCSKNLLSKENGEQSMKNALFRGKSGLNLFHISLPKHSDLHELMLSASLADATVVLHEDVQHWSLAINSFLDDCILKSKLLKFFQNQNNARFESQVQNKKSKATNESSRGQSNNQKTTNLTYDIFFDLFNFSGFYLPHKQLLQECEMLSSNLDLTVKNDRDRTLEIFDDTLDTPCISGLFVLSAFRLVFKFSPCTDDIWSLDAWIRDLSFCVSNPDCQSNELFAYEDAKNCLFRQVVKESLFSCFLGFNPKSNSCNVTLSNNQFCVDTRHDTFSALVQFCIHLQKTFSPNPKPLGPNGAITKTFLPSIKSENVPSQNFASQNASNGHRDTFPEHSKLIHECVEEKHEAARSGAKFKLDLISQHTQVSCIPSTSCKLLSTSGTSLSPASSLENGGTSRKIDEKNIEQSRSTFVKNNEGNLVSVKFDGSGHDLIASDSFKPLILDRYCNPSSISFPHVKSFSQDTKTKNVSVYEKDWMSKDMHRIKTPESVSIWYETKEINIHENYCAEINEMGEKSHIKSSGHQKNMYQDNSGIKSEKTDLKKKFYTCKTTLQEDFSENGKSVFSLPEKYPLPAFKIEGKTFQIRWRMFSGSDWPKLFDHGKVLQYHYLRSETAKERAERKLTSEKTKTPRNASEKCMECFVKNLSFCLDIFNPCSFFSFHFNCNASDYWLIDHSQNPDHPILSIHHDIYNDYDNNIHRMKTLIPKQKVQLRKAAVDLCLDSVRPSNFPFEEFRFFVKLNSIHISINQHQVEFFSEFFHLLPKEKDSRKKIEAIDKEEKHLNDSMVPFFQSIEIGSFKIIFDYYPSHMNLKSFKNGNFAEAVNLFYWKGVEISFKSLLERNVFGNEILLSKILGYWINDIASNQILGIAKGIVPIGDLYTMAISASKLFLYSCQMHTILMKYGFQGYQYYQLSLSKLLRKFSQEIIQICSDCVGGKSKFVRNIQISIRQKAESKSSLTSNSDSRAEMESLQWVLMELEHPQMNSIRNEIKPRA